MSYIALRGFLNGSQYQKRGRPIDVSGERARELQRLGLIAASEGKAAPAPQNKMRPDANNKGGENASSQPGDASALLSLNAPEVVAGVGGIGDIEVLQTLLKTEQAGKARKSVVEAIEAEIAARSA
ncbi:hypothetical protein [Achromobacter kerstersii]|uniref:hypothetical protein n=1 Tax=Achromobacter kerstersii TaxID=1353890 RepID=UPI003D01405E